ncbi:hypothetical protein [Halobacteriovorax sp. HLS]|uniref:hypothetical protein n=1 Tax=Halobacteriovorax sp. HLS TaxID=2234000 RepID=UPI000FDA5998|nr:hypothetical protein [Halobacteriovorax sp. HLS]
MRLLVFAHRAEAATFLKQGNFKSVESSTQSLYQNEEDYLLICGEGILNSLETVSTVLGELSNAPVEIINYGIAGSLSPKVDINSIVEVRTFYAQMEQIVEFKSFSTDSKELLDCITSSQRVLNKDYAQKLSCFASLVDREGWAIARAASNSNIKLRAFKLISDMALEHTEDSPICEIIKENAEIYSDKMWRHFCSLEFTLENEAPLLIDRNKSFYFTVSQYRNYKGILSSLLTKYESEEAILETCQISSIAEVKATEKQRAQLLIDKMRELQTPFNHKLTKQLDTILAPLKKAQLQVKLSKDFESDSFSISASIHNEMDLLQISQALKKFDYKNYQSILRGNIDV